MALLTYKKSIAVTRSSVSVALTELDERITFASSGLRAF